VESRRCRPRSRHAKECPEDDLTPATGWPRTTSAPASDLGPAADVATLVVRNVSELIRHQPVAARTHGPDPGPGPALLDAARGERLGGPITLSLLLGHRSPTTTADSYGHHVNPIRDTHRATNGLLGEES
jgi:hypothetical protein